MIGQIQFKPLHSIFITNPAKEIILLSPRNVLTGNFTYIIASAKGNVVQKGSFNQNNTLIAVPLNAIIAKGIYYLQVSNDKEQFTVKLLLE
ncbi:MAG: hypothetical protein C4330_07125 [Chitinophagaceae bacterium]